MTLKDLICNTRLNVSYPHYDKTTTDLVYIQSRKEVEKMSSSYRKSAASDYAVMNGTKGRSDHTGSIYTHSFLRSGNDEIIDIIKTDGSLIKDNLHQTGIGIRPALRLNIDDFIKTRDNNPSKFAITTTETIVSYLIQPSILVNIHNLMLVLT